MYGPLRSGVSWMLSISHLLQMGGNPRHRCWPSGPPQISHRASLRSFIVLSSSPSRRLSEPGAGPLSTSADCLRGPRSYDGLDIQRSKLHEASVCLGHHSITTENPSLDVDEPAVVAHDACFGAQLVSTGYGSPVPHFHAGGHALGSCEEDGVGHRFIEQRCQDAPMNYPGPSAVPHAR